MRRLITSQLALGRFLRQLDVLSKLRNIQDEVIKQIERMPIIYDLETDIRYLQGKQKGAEEATASALIRGMREGRQEGLQADRQEGEQETKRNDTIGLLRLGLLTPTQIATALDVSVEFVLTIQAQVNR